MQLQLNPNTKKRTPKIVREPQAHGTNKKATRQREVEFGRTANHGRHLTRVPL